jgi:predicted aspartyl protease
MVAAREKKVGRFKVEVELANNDDMAAVRRGYLTPDEVRRVKLQGIVDSGASGLVLPTAVAKQLGIAATGKVKVTYANRKSSQRDKVEGIYLELLGRHAIFTAHLEPRRDTALIGAIVLEELDFLVDPRRERIYPRDPDIVTSEAE